MIEYESDKKIWVCFEQSLFHFELYSTFMLGTSVCDMCASKRERANFFNADFIHHCGGKPS